MLNRLQEKMTHERKQQCVQPLAGLLLNGRSSQYCLGAQSDTCELRLESNAESRIRDGQFVTYRGAKHTFLAPWMAWYLDLMPSLGCLILRTLSPSWWAFLHTLCQIPMITLCDSSPALPIQLCQWGRLCFNMVN